MNILVTGASGYIGGRLIPELIKRGETVSVLVREPRKLKRHNWADVKIHKGDMLDPPSLRPALVNIDVAYYLVHSMTSSGANFEQLDREAASNFARAAAEAGVKRIIYLGGLGITGSALSPHLKSRHETGDVLRSAGVPVTELRAAIIVGSGSASFLIIYDLVRKLPFMICPKWVGSRCEPISIRQVIAYLIGVLDQPLTVGQTLEIGSGEILTYEQMMRVCAEVLGKRLYILRLPVLTPRLSSYWLNLVTQVPLSLARPLVEGLKNDVVCADHRINQWISVPQISYRESVKLAINKMRQNAVETDWTGANTATNSSPPEQGSLLKDERSIVCRASCAEIFKHIDAIGGDVGWYHADFLWQLRAGIDWAIGGVGMRRGRKDPDTLFVGDAVDFWRVEDREQDRRLVLRAEMKLPGVARLTFEIEPLEEKVQHSLLKLKAHFWPSGIWGKLYWYAVCPLHSYVFLGMLRAIARRAEDRSQT